MNEGSCLHYLLINTKTAAGKLAMIAELMEMTIKTGKPGRPKKMLTKKQARKLLKDIK